MALLLPFERAFLSIASVTSVNVGSRDDAFFVFVSTCSCAPTEVARASPPTTRDTERFMRIQEPPENTCGDLYLPVHLEQAAGHSCDVPPGCPDGRIPPREQGVRFVWR